MARYIKSFIFPYLDKENCYPYSVLAPKKLRHIEFEPVTIFYGSNGSGKSTLLNLISRKLEISMKDKGNDGRFIQPVIDKTEKNSEMKSWNKELKRKYLTRNPLRSKE